MGKGSIPNNPVIPKAFNLANVAANIGNSNGKSKERPDKETDVPKIITTQKIIFWPALNFFADG